MREQGYSKVHLRLCRGGTGHIADRQGAGPAGIDALPQRNEEAAGTGVGYNSPPGPLVQGAGGPTVSATNFEASTPASVEPAEETACADSPREK